MPDPDILSPLRDQFPILVLSRLSLPVSRHHGPKRQVTVALAGKDPAILFPHFIELVLGQPGVSIGQLVGDGHQGRIADLVHRYHDVFNLGDARQGAAALILTWGLLTLGLIDYDTRLLPDLITLPLLWIGLLLSLAGLFSDPASAIIGAVLGYLALWNVYQLFKLATGKAGMGYGDFKLLAMLGAWLGWQHLPQIIIFSAVVGAAVGVTLIVIHKHDRDIPIPFGPYLAAAGWISLMWGDAINRVYLLWVGIV